jgi:hypothetical protein
LPRLAIAIENIKLVLHFLETLEITEISLSLNGILEIWFMRS